MFVLGEVAITIQKPSHQSAWTQWLLWKQSPNITPPNLRNRSWQDFPGTEVCRPPVVMMLLWPEPVLRP